VQSVEEDRPNEYMEIGATDIEPSIADVCKHSHVNHSEPDSKRHRFPK
jgi:hypothetical protein